LSDFSLKEIQQTLFVRGIVLYDKTISLPSKPRSMEIIEWLLRNRATRKFAILDDREDAGRGLKQHFFQTRRREGLTDEIAQTIIRYLE